MKRERDGRRALPAVVVLLCLVSIGLIAPELIGSASRHAATGVIAASRDITTVTVPVEISSAPRIVLERGTVSQTVSRPAEGLLSSSSDQDHIAISQATVAVYIKTRAANAEAAAPGEALAPIAKAIADLGFQSLTLSKTDIVFHSESGSTETLEDVSAAVKDSGAMSAKGSLTYRGERFTFDIAFGRPSATTPQVPVRAKISGKPLTVRFDGHLATGEHMQVRAPNAELLVHDARATARWLGQLWTAGPGLGAFTANGLLILDERSATFENARFTIDGNKATGALTLAAGSERPAFMGTLAFETLSLAPYGAQKSTMLSMATGFLSNLRLPGMAAPSLVRAIDADLRLSASAVSAGSTRLGGCAASINIRDGKLMGEIAEIEFENGGTGTTRFEVDMTGSSPRMRLAADLEGVDLGKLGEVFGRRLVEGQGKLSLDLKAAGVTEQAVLASATGTIALEMLEGGKLGFNVDALKTAARSTSPSSPISEVTTSGTPVDRLVARFTGAQGVFNADAFEAISGERAIVAQGSVGTANRDIDLTVTLTSGANGTASDSPAREAYRVRGPWASPAISPVSQPGKSAAPRLPAPFAGPLNSRG